MGKRRLADRKIVATVRYISVVNLGLSTKVDILRRKNSIFRLKGDISTKSPNLDQIRYFGKQAIFQPKVDIKAKGRNFGQQSIRTKVHIILTKRQILNKISLFSPS